MSILSLSGCGFYSLLAKICTPLEKGVFSLTGQFISAILDLNAPWSVNE